MRRYIEYDKNILSESQVYIQIMANNFKIMVRLGIASVIHSQNSDLSEFMRCKALYVQVYPW